MFVWRQRELGVLNERYQSGEFEFVCLYGRRRVGKTELIKEFIKGKKAIFFSALEDTPNANLAALSEAISNGLRGFGADFAFGSYEGALAEICEAAKKERVVFIIDE